MARRRQAGEAQKKEGRRRLANLGQALVFLSLHLSLALSLLGRESTLEERETQNELLSLRATSSATAPPFPLFLHLSSWLHGGLEREEERKREEREGERRILKTDRVGQKDGLMRGLDTNPYEQRHRAGHNDGIRVRRDSHVDSPADQTGDRIEPYDWIQQQRDSQVEAPSDHSDRVEGNDGTRRRLDSQVASILGADALRKAYGLTGKGQTVMCADSGVYMAHDQFRPEDLSTIPYDSYNASQRKVVSYLRISKNSIDESDGCGHGTHVCGLLAGSSASGKFPDLGTAPGAKLIVMDVGVRRGGAGGGSGKEKDAVLEIPPVDILFGKGYERGVRLFSFSWGHTSAVYDAQAAAFDNYLSINSDVAVFAAAGNLGDGTQVGVVTNGHGGVIYSPAIAKNVISVGASVNTHQSFRHVAETCPGYNHENLASLSSRGPAPDGRRKPEIVCPGYHVESARAPAEDVAAKNPWAITNGTCTDQGTSQATASCAGAGTLLYQWLKEGRYRNGEKDDSLGFSPSAALIKALLIHSATPLKLWLPDAAKVSTCDELLSKSKKLFYGDSVQGFGVVNLRNIMPLPGSSEDSFPFFVPSNVPSLDELGPAAVKANEVRTYVFPNVSCSLAFKAVLAWTDPAAGRQGWSQSAGGTTERQLVNDLDLEVVEVLPNGERKTYFPVGTNGTRDRVNNAEVVLVNSRTAVGGDGKQQEGRSAQCTRGRSFEVRVIGSSLGSGTSQKFALTASAMEDVYKVTAAAPGPLLANMDEPGWAKWLRTAAIAGSCLLAAILVGFIVLKSVKRRKRLKTAQRLAVRRASVMGRMSIVPPAPAPSFSSHRLSVSSPSVSTPSRMSGRAGPIQGGSLSSLSSRLLAGADGGDGGGRGRHTLSLSTLAPSLSPPPLVLRESEIQYQGIGRRGRGSLSRASPSAMSYGRRSSLHQGLRPMSRTLEDDLEGILFSATAGGRHTLSAAQMTPSSVSRASYMAMRGGERERLSSMGHERKSELIVFGNKSRRNGGT